MNVHLLCLTVVLLSSPLLTLCDPLFVLSAPNLLRVGSSENVFVEAQDYNGDNLNVKIVVKNHPRKNQDIVSETVTLTAGNNYQLLTKIKILDEKKFFTDDPLEKQYVYLQAHFPSEVLEKVVMVSFQSGYIFVQTDKPIYTPGSTVQYRIFSLTPNLHPLSQSVISMDIMNPQELTVSTKKVFPAQGMNSEEYQIPEVASSGIWKVVTRYANTPQKTFTADFEVKEYVLPTFEVTLNPRKAFFYVGDESLTVDITAKYLFGQKVDGQAFVLFGVMEEDIKTSIAASLKREPIINGMCEVVLTREMILKTFPNMNQLVGKSIFVSVSVLTETGSEMVEAHRRGIQIVTSPYTIHFKRTPQFFKPGMPFDVSVYVTNPDETPAVNVDIEVNPGGVRSQTKSNGIAKVTINTPGRSSRLDITIKTRDPQLQSEQQAVKTMTAQAYGSGKSKNYLHIGIDGSEFQIGDQMKVNLNTMKSLGVGDQDYTYMILSKGQIVTSGRFKRRGQSLVTLSLPVTKDMVPSFRFVAYYHVGSNEVVSDSVWVDVKDTCMGSLKVEVRDAVNVYAPGERFSLVLKGDPGAKVGLVAVDKGVYVLNNKNRLTQSKIWDIVEKHDTGCTAGSGKWSMQVFRDAGLVFESSTAGGTSIRTYPECPSPSLRKKREVTVVQHSNSLLNKYTGLEKDCCTDGMKILQGYTCSYRSSFIVDGEECRRAFLHCCEEMTRVMTESEQNSELTLARSETENFMNSDSIVTRTLFPESWLWEEVTLPNCPSLNPNCQTTSVARNDIQLKDSITTWEITAISLSKTQGICVADVHEMTVRKVFFIDLKIPYSAVRNEQIEIKAVIYNFYSSSVKVRVELKETKDVCSMASNKRKYYTTVTVNAKSSYSVPFVIVPLALGRHSIEVKAAASGRDGDGVKKDLLVVPEGVSTKLGENLQISSKRGTPHVQVVKSLILKDQAPNTPANTYITATGESISITIEKAISGQSMGSLIVQPGGCGEQNMARMTMPVIATHYLDRTSQWHTVGIGLRQTAVTYITRGYNQQLAYRKGDGSYGAWINRPSSTWLTAYVAKVFAMSSNIVNIDQNLICSALRWLILNRQRPDGSYREDAPVIHGEMTGNVRGHNSQASMTAFVLIALQEGRGICGGIPSFRNSIAKATAYLKAQLHALANPYAVAMVSYALANENALDKQVLLSKGSADGSNWPVGGSIYYGLEASAYALLAFVKAKDFQRAAPIVNWLNSQRRSGGGYGTTQATIMVFQAVAEYRIQVTDIKSVDMELTIRVEGMRPVVWTFNKNIAHLTRTEKIPSNREISITSKGFGEASVTVMTTYYAKPKERSTDCKNFELELLFEKEDQVTYHGASESYKLTINSRYLSTDRDATMSILDVSLLTGFVVDEADLKALSTGHGRLIQKFEMNKQLSERGSLILYLDKIPHQSKNKVTFRLHRVMDAGFLQPAAVTVYEYYSIDNRCMKFYHPTRKEGALKKICHKEVCKCAEENCSLQRKEKIDEALRNKKACEPTIDYVFKAVLLNEDEDLSLVSYTMRIEMSLKKGPEKDVVGRNRIFTSQISCEKALGLKKGTSYLIMGQTKDVQLDGRNGQYALGERTWVEHWPTKAESESSPQLKAKYDGMSSLRHDLLYGC